MGSPKAMVELGIMYECGSGVEKSYEEAFNWYKKAYDLNHYGAACHIGILYFHGDGVQKDYTGL